MLRALLALAGTDPDRSLIWNRPTYFYTHTHCADSKIAQLRRLAWTVNAWQSSIIEGLITGISNGRTQEDRPRHWGGIVFTRIVQTSHDFPFCRCGAARVLA